MRKITKLMLALALCVVSVGASAIRLNATFSTPASNGSWDGNTNTYTWTGNTNNLMTIFTFPNGELANYSKIHLEVAQTTHHNFRFCLMNGSTPLGTVTCWSSGIKDITFSEHENTRNVDLSQVTHIAFGGASTPGDGEDPYSCVLTNVYLEGPDPLYHEVYALGSPITFEQALASTDPFVLVQNGKVLCGPLSATDGSLTYKDVSDINDYSWTIKFEEDKDNEGSYFMELCNSHGASKGFINASVWSHTYLSGVDKATTKGEQQNGALWTITATSNGKYTIKNLGVSQGYYNNKPNDSDGNRDEKGQGYLAITTNGYWAEHVTIYNTSGEWEFYSLSTAQQTTNDPLYFGWDEMSFSNATEVTKDDETHLVVDSRGYAPYWAETASWKFNTPFDATGYRYLVFYAKRNITKYGNGDNDTGGTLFIKDNTVTFRQDDYTKYNNVDYPNVSGSMWMNRWGDQRVKVLDLQWLANADKYGDGSECKVLDITNIKEIGIAGTFTIGGIFFTNTEPSFSAGDYKRSFDSFDKFGTICLPYSAVCCGAQLYEIVGKSENGISLAEYEGIMEPGKPYLYKTLEAKKGDNDETDVYFFKAGYKKVAAPVENNGLIGTFTNTTAPRGENYYVLSSNELYQVDSEVAVGANKAYIDASKVTNKSEAKSRAFINFEGQATGIAAIENNDAVNAITNAAIYNLNGQRVMNPTRGIYIVNGKKLFIK